MAKAKAVSETSLKRESAGQYASRDGRFTVEQSSGRWMLIDAESADDLGLPLVRGPFATLDAARDAIETARSGPVPTSNLAKRIAAMPAARGKPAADARTGPSRMATRSTSHATSLSTTRKKPGPAPTARAQRPAPIELRDYRRGDGEALRALWKEAGLQGRGDDDRSLDAFAKRNPGLVLVATAGDDLAGSALAAWDGRESWLYHVATAKAHRRRGVASRLVRRLEQRLRTLGCPKVNLFICEGNEDAEPFWTATGYAVATSRPMGKEI